MLRAAADSRHSASATWLPGLHVEFFGDAWIRRFFEEGLLCLCNVGTEAGRGV